MEKLIYTEVANDGHFAADISICEAKKEITGILRTKRFGDLEFKTYVKNSSAIVSLDGLEKKGKVEFPITLKKLSNYIQYYKSQHKQAIAGEYKYDPTYLTVDLVNYCISNYEDNAPVIMAA